MIDEPTTSQRVKKRNPSVAHSLLKFIVVAGGGLLVAIAFLFGRAVMDWRNGCPDRLHVRANPVNPASLLRLPISPDASVPTADLRAIDRRAPLRYRADVLKQRAGSVAVAAQVFDDLCQDGWTFDTFNQYDKSEFTYGGQGANRFCASQVIQNRHYLGYVPLCGSSKHFVSYVIVQREDVVFAAYESTASQDRTGQDANRALLEIMRQLR